MIYFKYDVLLALKNKGYTSYKLINKKILPAGTITKIRNNEAEKLSLLTINKICELLECQPGDLLNWTPDATKNTTNQNTIDIENKVAE